MNRIEVFEKKRKWLIYAMCAFILAQPFFDIFTSLGTRTGSSITFGVIVRTLFIIGLCLYVLFFCNYKKYRMCFLYLALVTVYCIAFILNILAHSNFSAAIGNVKDLIKTYYFNYLFVGIYIIYKEFKYTISDRILSYVVTIYIAVIFLAFITGTSFKSYNWGYGYNGWFYAANEIGSIIAILTPISFTYFIDKLVFYKNQKPIVVIISMASIFLTVFCSTFVGTKVVFLGIFSCIFCYSLWNVVQYFSNKEKLYLFRTSISIIVALLVIGSYFISPLKANINTGEYKDIVPSSSSSSAIINNIENNSVASRVTSQNENLNSSGTNSFSTFKSSAYKLLNRILSNRLTFIKPISNEFANSNFSVRCLGLGYITLPSYQNNVNKSLELDIMTIYYRHGYVGFILFFSPIIIGLMMVIYLFFHNFKKSILSLSLCNYLLSLMLGLFISITAGHVLVAPAVSIYIAIIFVKIRRSEAENLV